MGESHVNFPWSTSMPAATAVNSFVFDAIGKSVLDVIGNFLP